MQKQVQAKAHFYFAADSWSWSIYSDVYKSEFGIRPRGSSPESAYAYMQEKADEYKAHQQLRAEFPKRTLVNIYGVLGRVIGYESDTGERVYGREGLKVRSLTSGAVIDADPRHCVKVQ